MSQFNRIILIAIGLVMCFSIVAALHVTTGDIVTQTKNSGFKNAQINVEKWPNGVIPYVIEASTSQEVRDAFLKYMVDLAEQTDKCISFVPRTNENSYLIINHTYADGCYSSIGMEQEPQTLSLGKGCTDRGALFHETLHAVGFHHEQCRPDRDDYLEILVENVKADNLFNFDKYPSTMVTTLGLPYDYYSIMHYDVTSFTKQEGIPTMKVKDPNVESDLVGESQVLTLLDILKVKKFYGCIPDSTNTLKIAINEKDSGKFVSASADALIADAASSTTSSQQFEVSFNSDSTVCLKSLASQKYVAVNADGVLMASGNDCKSDSARIYLARLHDGDYVLRSKGKLKYIKKNEDLSLIANVDLRSDATTFVVSRL